MIRFAENLNKMIAAGLGGALDPPRTEVAVGHRVVYTEASGAVVNFKTNVIAPVKNLRVTMEPIQDLHGQDAPYPAGGGKNKFSGVWPPDITGTYCAWEMPSTSYCRLAIYDNGNNSDISDVYFGMSENGTTTPVTWIVSNGTLFEPAYNAQNNCYTLGYADRKYVTLYPPTQEALTKIMNRFKVTCFVDDQSEKWEYTPYSNICPISGRTDVTVWREALYDPSADPALTVQLGQTVYGGTLDVSTGKLTVTHGEIASYNGEVLTGEWISDRDVYAAGTTPTIGAQVVYVLDTPQTIDLDPQQITTLIGDNNVWTDVGDVTLDYPYYEETEGY